MQAKEKRGAINAKMITVVQDIESLFQIFK